MTQRSFGRAPSPSIRNMLEVMAFMAVCAAPLVLSLLGIDGSSSHVELRNPEPLPPPPRTIGQFVQYAPRLQAYINDHFGGRPQLVRLNGLMRLALGASGSPSVTIGRQGWLFLRTNGDVLDRHRGLVMFSEGDLEDWVREYERRQAWLRRRGISLFFFIVPDKHSIYGEYLPARYKLSNVTPTDQLLMALRDHAVPGVVDLRALMYSTKTKSPVYPKTDTHWTDFGAFTAYQEMVNVLQEQGLAVYRLKAQDLSYSPKCIGGDLARLLGLKNDLREWIDIASVDNTAVINAEGKSFRTSGVTISTSHITSPTALVLGDSFVRTVEQKFLQESFRQARFMHHQDMAFSAGLVETFCPDAVIYIVVERLIPLHLDSCHLPEDTERPEQVPQTYPEGSADTSPGAAEA